MKRYDSYKDSGVDWIGEVPSHWEVLSLLYTLRGKIIDGPHETPNYVEEGIPFISIDSINDTKDIDLSVVKKYISELDYKVYSKKTKIDFGDVLFTKAATIGKTAIVGNEKFMVWSPLAILKANKEILNNQFLYYLLNIERAITAVILSGSFSTQINVGMREMEKLKIMLPSLREQESIVFYLDSKCGEIDKVISTQEKRIALLQELKQSIITHAVTKGLNPDVKMKDSGIEWIGEVPEHWKVCKIKRLSVVKRGASPRPIENPIYFDDNGQYSWVRIADVTDSKKYLYSTTQKLSKLGSSLSVKMHPGEIFLSIAGTVGKPIITKIDCCIHDGFVWFPNLKIEPEYLYYIFLSGRPYLGLGKLGTQLNLNTETVGYISIPIPEGKEITDIVSYLDKRCASIDTYISKAQKEIELLQEYKQSLITEVVTGKRKVC